MTSDRWARWKRFVSEGVVIVVSILLAFWIDAGWESRQERRQEMDYLSQVQTELRGARIELDEAVRNHSGLAAYGVTLLAGVADIPDDSLVVAARFGLVIGRSTNLRSGLMDPTQLALVSDLELRALLSRWPAAYAELEEEEEAASALIPSILATAGAHVDLSALLGGASMAALPPPDVEELRRQLERALAVPGVRSAMGARIRLEDIAARDARLLRDLTDEILEVILERTGGG